MVEADGRLAGAVVPSGRGRRFDNVLWRPAGARYHPAAALRRGYSVPLVGVPT